LIEKNKKKLIKANISNAQNEITWFLEKKFDLTKEQILLKEFELTNHQEQVFNDFINRRVNHEPFQYILNSATFCGLDFYVNPSVLIPRPETELIIDILIKNSFEFHSAIDVGTGSGNLAILLSKKKIAQNILAIDNSSHSLEVAKKNIDIHNITNIEIQQLDFLQTTVNRSFDLLICNPPYISLKEYSQLELGVKKYEPKFALTDNSDGLKFYINIKNNINDLVNKNGMILLEIGLEKHKNKIDDIFKNFSYKWHKDLNGNYRVIQIFK
tara:strand:- start:690 stop:1499 length:810 start_codon:yes stop_codon:yes gene_type:complete